MMRALLRVVVLGGLVVAAWLLGSGTGHADEDLAVPPAIGSTVTSVLSATPVPQLSVQPPVKVDILRPVVHALGVPKFLTPVLAPVVRPLSGPTHPGTAIRSHAPAEKAEIVPPAAPTVRVVAAAAPGPAPVLTAVSHSAPQVVTDTAAHRVADPFAGQSVLRSDPLAPLPASPPGSTTSPCLVGSTAGGASTKSAPDLAVNNSWATALLAPLHLLRYVGASDLLRSSAARPSTSPD